MKLRNLLNIFLTSIAICHCTFASGEELSNLHKDISANGKFYVSVFNCKIELPTEYILNAKDFGRFLFTKDSNGIGRISISKYDNSIEHSGKLDIVKQQDISGLTVLFVKARWHPLGSVIIHDDNFAVTIIGDDTNIWKGIVQSCIHTRMAPEPSGKE